MTRHTQGRWGQMVIVACAAALLMARPARAEDADLREIKERLDRLEKENEYLRKVLEKGLLRVSVEEPPAAAKDEQANQKKLEDAISAYLKEHPGVGTPKGVQMGYTYGNGFSIRSVPNPKWVNWDDEMSQLPFELRIRGRLQAAYYHYNPTDNFNHQTNQEFGPLFGGVENDPEFSALEIKRARLIFEGHAFDPALKYRVQLNADTRGLGGFYNNNHIVSGSPVAGGAAAVEGGGVTIDHAMRLFEAWISYDIKPGRCKDDCCDSPCCPDGLLYTPTYTLIAGKVKLLGPLEEYLGSGNEQFVEFSMASWFFSPDDDNLAVAAGVQAKMLQDRLYAVALVTNGSESNFSANQIDDHPGFNVGFWYDFGGTWDENRKAWQLFGDSMSDIDYSRNPVVRVGAAANFVPMDRRALYGDAEQSRFRTVDGGARIIDVLNGGFGLPGVKPAQAGLHAVDRFNAYTFNTFVAAKYRGLSLSNEWWFRVLDEFRTVPQGQDLIFYRAFVGNQPRLAIYPGGSLFDFGTQLQGGYFVIPNKIELVGRWSAVWGESGDILGGFSNTEMANEYTLGMNWFVRRHLLKWQTDFGIYDGGNPASASAAGFITNRDGYLFRTQVQLAF